MGRAGEAGRKRWGGRVHAWWLGGHLEVFEVTAEALPAREQLAEAAGAAERGLHGACVEVDHEAAPRRRRRRHAVVAALRGGQPGDDGLWTVQEVQAVGGHEGEQCGAPVHGGGDGRGGGGGGGGARGAVRGEHA